MKTKPLISYYGGKQRMASKIVPLIPPHTVYCEPFAGGASVFYAKPKPSITNSNHYREILNDINGDLVNMYRVAMESPDSFSASIRAIPFSASIHRGSRESYSTDRERALAFFINNQQSFGNICHGGWRRGTFGRDCAKTWALRQGSIKESASRLSGVSLDNIDVLAFIKKWDSPQTFFYLDPPYSGTWIDGMGKWGAKDDARLLECLNETKGSFILSGYKAPLTTLHNAHPVSFCSHCSVTGAGKTDKGRNHGDPIKGVGRERTEWLHMRGPAHPVRSSLIPVLEKQTCFTGPLLGPCPLPLKRAAEVAS